MGKALGFCTSHSSGMEYKLVARGGSAGIAVEKTSLSSHNVTYMQCLVDYPLIDDRVTFGTDPWDAYVAEMADENDPQLLAG